jgi:hypothetical protein
MLVEQTILHMNPNLKWGDFEIFGTDDNWQIVKWNSTEMQPTKQAIIDYWTANESTIMEKEKPEQPKNVIGDLQKNQSDLIYQLMMAGVI